MVSQPVSVESDLWCPACAGAVDHLACVRCARKFLRVDGIACLVDAEELAREQGPMIARDWLAVDTEAVAANCAEAGAADPTCLVYRERVLESVFALAHYPEARADSSIGPSLSANRASLARLGAWLDRHPPIASPSCSTALEVGCGPGGFLFELARRFPGGVVGFDLRIGLLRIARRMIEVGQVSLPWRAQGPRFRPMTLRVADRAAGAITLVQGHLTHAPFRRAAFPLVAALSLLDVLPDPLDGLRRLDALVAPGGLLLLTCPYQWQADVTAPHLWWSSPEDTLRDTLRGRGYDIVEEDTALAWAVPSHARLVHVYALHALLARKRR